MSADSSPIAIVPKNHRERVQIALSEYEGYHLVNVRIFYDDGTEFKPTKKGIALKVERLPDLIDGLEKAAVEARRRGLIE